MARPQGKGNTRLVLYGWGRGRTLYQWQVSGTYSEKSKGTFRSLSSAWNDVKYEPGEIKVVAYDEKGNQIGEDVRQTAGKAVQLVAQAETEQHQADGEDLIYIRISVKDKKGVPVPTCQDALTFSVSGEAKFEAACNGDATSLESFRQPKMKLFNGELIVILRPTTKAGNVTLTVKDQRGKMKPAILNLETK